MSLVRPVMTLYVFFAIHEVYEEVSKPRRITDCICARNQRITARPPFRTKSIKKPSITINQSTDCTAQPFVRCSEVSNHLYQSTDCTAQLFLGVFGSKQSFISVY